MLWENVRRENYIFGANNKNTGLEHIVAAILYIREDLINTNAYAVFYSDIFQLYQRLILNIIHKILMKNTFYVDVVLILLMRYQAVSEKPLKTFI